MKHFLVFTLLFVGLAGYSQDVTGIWRGNFFGKQNKLMQMLGEEDRYKFELQIEQNAKAFEGVTYSYKTTIFYGKATCRGTVNPKNGKVFLEELKLVEVKMQQGSSACVMTCNLQYSKMGEEEFLEGTYTSYNEADSSNCGGGTIFLRKVVTSDFYKEPFLVERENRAKKPAPKPKTGNLSKSTAPPAQKTTAAPPVRSGATAKSTTPTKPATTPSKRPPTTTKKPETVAKSTTPPKEKDNTTPPPADKVHIIPRDADAEPAPPPAKVNIPKVLSTRENELVKTIFVNAGKISINIYDNGTVDNDTISVYLDKKLVLSKRRLTEQPLKLSFTLNEEVSEHELIMVAENLGEIPPNTSLMVVTAGDQKYEVRITSTEQKNAAVVFKLKK